MIDGTKRYTHPAEVAAAEERAAAKIERAIKRQGKVHPSVCPALTLSQPEGYSFSARRIVYCDVEVDANGRHVDGCAPHRADHIGVGRVRWL